MMEYLDTLKKTDAPFKESFEKSPYELILVTDGARHSFPMTLFSGYAMSEQDPSGIVFLDNRIDFEINGSKISFSSSEGIKCPESAIDHYYNRSASLSRLPARWEIEGFDKGKNFQPGIVRQWAGTIENYGLRFEFGSEVPDWCSVLEKSNYVVLVKYIGPGTVNVIGSEAPVHCESFIVSEVLKDSVGRGKQPVFLIKQAGVASAVSDEEGQRLRFTQMVYGDPCDPPYLPEKMYLLCFNVEADPGDIKALPDYVGPLRSAKVEDDLLLPRYNTEHHPFFGIQLKDIKEYLKSSL